MRQWVYSWLRSVAGTRVFLPAVLASLSFAVFAVVSLRHLDVIPPVHEDEPWQASVAYKLATEGIFGSDLFSGFYHMEERYYDFMPVSPLILSALFRLWGVGLLQARLDSVAMGLIVLILTFALGRRLFGAWVGALAVFFLVFVRWTALTQIQYTGIPLIDLSRIARYDVVVPVFGLGALHLYLSARTSSSRLLYLLAGLLAGLAGLSHLYGAFWLAALLLLAAWEGGREFLKRPAVYLLSAGFLLVWLPYLAYVVTGIVDFRGQTQNYGYEGRFDLLDPGWYWQNLLAEPRRYGPGLGPADWSWLLRLGWWLTVLAVPVSVAMLAVRAVRTGDESARAVVVPLLAIGTLFALLLKLKLVNYGATLLPLGAIAAAWGVAQLWRRLPGGGWATSGRLALATALAVVAIEGGLRMASLEGAAAQTTPYMRLADQMRQHIPAGARVLVLHRYWFGLTDHDVRTFWVPIQWTNARLVPDPVPLGAALDRVAPDVVILDPRMMVLLQKPAEPEVPVPELAAAFWGWMELREARLLARLEDATYGTMDVYEVVWRDSWHTIPSGLDTRSSPNG